ncbi:NepR family anti-sigma factor [Microvirga soli]|uniref:NepR family anti-sigma factor n=1 Tax=Microvirga soli TaxID=1854496 RepID=UPI00191F89CB|nr:NepR family anti-sigma factor [Microvirga soli]
MQKKNPNIMHNEDTETVPGLHGSSSPALSRSVQAQIGQRLRQFYETLALGEQPVPDRFIEIINRLDERAPEKHQS